MTIKVSERTEKIIDHIKTRSGKISNVSAVDFLATSYLEMLFNQYQSSECKIDEGDSWRWKHQQQFYDFLDSINYTPLG